MSLTVSTANNINTIEGNGLALYLDNKGNLMLKDVNGKTDLLSNYINSGGGGDNLYTIDGEIADGVNRSVDMGEGSSLSFESNRGSGIEILSDLTDYVRMFSDTSEIRLSQDGETPMQINASTGLSLIIGLGAPEEGQVLTADMNGNAIWATPEGGGTTNLGYTAGGSNGTITNDNGSNAVIPLATGNLAGLVPTYQVNSFTPSLVDAGGGATYTTGQAVGRVIKIGNFVSFMILFTNINTTGTPTGALRVNGISFTPATVAPCTIGSIGGVTSFTGDMSSIGAFITAFGSQVQFAVNSDETTGDQDSDYSAVSFTGGRLEISGSYIFEQPE